VTSVVVGPGQTIFVFLRLKPSCTPDDSKIAPLVVLDLRSADGKAGQTVIRPADGYDVGYGMPYDGWVSASLGQVCGAP
jgi:hypothetical protein